MVVYDRCKPREVDGDGFEFSWEASECEWEASEFSWGASEFD